jgi:hypothetical protein
MARKKPNICIDSSSSRADKENRYEPRSRKTIPHANRTDVVIIHFFMKFIASNYNLKSTSSL